MTRWKVVRLDEIPRPARSEWIPVRRQLGVRAFGVNAWVGDEVGSKIVSEHDEVTTGHEELYVVIRGRATFTIAGDEIDATVGTILFVGDPAVKRAAVAAEPGTIVFTAGAKPGEAFAVSPWEHWSDIAPLFDAQDYAGALAVLERALEEAPDDPGILYNLACAESLLGRRDDALEHLARAIEGREPLRAIAREDEDFASVRDDARFVSLVAGESGSDGSPA